MNKIIPLFCFLLITIFFTLAAYKIITLYKKNHIYINNTIDYIKILDDAHTNINNYIGKKIKISGYTYMQEDFPDNRFVLAHNAFLDFSSEPYIVGFLCENHTKATINHNQTISIIGKIVKGSYNELEYPIIYVTKIKKMEF